MAKTKKLALDKKADVRIRLFYSPDDTKLIIQAIPKSIPRL